MKKTILSIAIAAIISSCGSKTEPVVQDAVAQQNAVGDTAGLAEYQNWKQQKEQLQELNLEGVTEAPQAQVISPVYESATPAPKVIYRNRPAKTTRTVTYKQPAAKYEEPDYTSTTRQTGTSREAVSRNDGGVSGGDTGAGDGNGTSVSDGGIVATEPVPAKKEGWSKAAKGAVIGAGSGAVLGAIIGKNKAKGAVIGAVIGGAGGYVLGRSKDKKDGRYLVSNN